MSESPTTTASRPAKKIKLVAAAAALLLVLLLVVLTAKPFSGSGDATAKAASDDPYALSFDGDDFSGKDATPETVKTEPVAQRDSEEKYASACASCAKKHKVAELPAASTTTHVAAGAPSADEVAKNVKKQFAKGKGAEVGSDGQAKPPVDAPEAVKNVIAAGNQIANYPYIWGGGHASFQANGYDCSGSVSYALKGANLVNEPMVSGDFMNYGEPGPGKWITIYSSPGHVFMFVGGLRFDTSFRDGPYGTRWQDGKRGLGGFAVTHPVGL
jgi:cell wall-associated NlpC family hydrolase